MTHSVGMRVGLGMACTAITAAFTLGGLMILFEDAVLDILFGQGADSLIRVYGGRVAELDDVVRRSWQLLERGILWSGGLGLGSILLALLITVLSRGSMPVIVITCSTGAAALLCMVYWIAAALWAPALGSTDSALYKLSLLAWMWLGTYGSGLLLCLRYVFFSPTL